MSYRIKTGDGQAEYSLRSRSNTALHGISRGLIAMLTRLRVPATVALRRPRRRRRDLHGFQGRGRGAWVLSARLYPAQSGQVQLEHGPVGAMLPWSETGRW